MCWHWTRAPCARGWRCPPTPSGTWGYQLWQIDFATRSRHPQKLKSAPSHSHTHTRTWVDWNRRKECEELTKLLRNANFDIQTLADIKDDATYQAVMDKFGDREPALCARLSYIYSAQKCASASASAPPPAPLPPPPPVCLASEGWGRLQAILRNDGGVETRGHGHGKNNPSAPSPCLSNGTWC